MNIQMSNVTFWSITVKSLKSIQFHVAFDFSHQFLHQSIKSRFPRTLMSLDNA